MTHHRQAFLRLIKNLDKVYLPIISNFQKQTCDAKITEEEIYCAPKWKNDNNKAPGNDVQNLLLAWINDVFIKEQLITSQKQAVVKSIEKKRDKRFIIIPRALAVLLKDVIHDLNSSSKIANV